MPEKNLEALFLHTLKDIYFAEQAALKNMPSLAQAAKSEALKEAFERHQTETQGQIRRLDQVFKLMGEKPQGETCEAMQGLIQETQETIKEFGDGEAADAGLVSAAQAIEHYEIARYGTLYAWAKQLGMDEAAGLLKETLVEEESTDELLSELAEDVINPAAV